MFQFNSVPVLPAQGFITHLGFSVSDPLIGCCRFDLQRFHETLSVTLALPVPPRLEQAVKKRRAEYLASRFLAREMMRRLGHLQFILDNAPDRSPCWPDGIAASLSHSDGTAVLAASRQPLCLGIDVERIMKPETAEETAEILMTRAEKQRLLALPLPFPHAATLLFSLKESLYKALWPVLHQPMDFRQAALVDVDIFRQRAQLRLTHRFSAAFPAGTLLDARFQFQEDQVLTLISHNANGNKKTGS